MNQSRIISKKQRHWLQSSFIAIILLCMIAWGIVAALGAFRKNMEAKDLRNQYSRDLAQLESKRIELNEKIDTLSTVRGIESEVRNRYRVVKPGEQMVIVVDNRDPALNKGNKLSFWNKVRDFVGF